MPKGSTDKRTELRELLLPHAPALIDKAVELALGGHIAALKLCLDRIIPSMRPIDIATLTPERPVKFVLKMGKNLKPSDEIE